MNNGSKTYKFLRIVFLTLAIISLVFTLYKKITHAEGSNNTYRTTMPLYVSPVSGANQGKPADIDLSGMRNALLTYLINDGFYSPSIKYITYEGRSESDTIIYVNAFSNNANPSVSNYPSLNLNSFTSESNFSFGIGNGIYSMWYNYSTGACGMHTHNNTPFVLNSYISLYYNGATPFYALIPNQFIPGYPLYIENDIMYGNDVVFTDYANIPSEDEPIYSGSSIGGSGTGTFIPSDDGSGGSSEGGLGGGTFDFDLDLNLDDSAIIGAIESVGDDIGGALDDIGGSVDSIESKLDTQNSKIDSTNSKLDTLHSDLQSLTSQLSSSNNSWDKVKAFFGWLYDHGLSNGSFDFMELLRYLFVCDANTLQTSLQNNSMNQDLSTLKQDVNTLISDVSNTQASESYYWEFKFSQHADSGSPLKETGDFRVYFDFWQHIRDKFWRYFRYFFVFGNLLLFFRKIPSAINGISSAGDSDA